MLITIAASSSSMISCSAIDAYFRTLRMIKKRLNVLNADAATLATSEIRTVKLKKEDPLPLPRINTLEMNASMIAARNPHRGDGFCNFFR